MKITRIAQSCIAIESNGKTIVIDPYRIPDGSVKADIVLITHPHPDHYDPKSMERIKKEGMMVACPASCKKIISVWQAKGVMPGEIFEMDNVSIKTVSAYNKKKPFHSRGKKYVGYLVSIEGKTLYHAGDTDFIPEMEAIQAPDVAFLPIGGFFTMDTNEAIEAIKVIKPAKIIPMHENKQDLAVFAAKVQSEVPEVEVCTLHAGESTMI